MMQDGVELGVKVGGVVLDRDESLSGGEGW